LSTYNTNAEAFSDTNPPALAMQQLRNIAGIICKRRWSIITFVLIVMTVVSVYSFSARPVYKASTLVRINRDELKVMSFQEFVTADESTDELIGTETEIIGSRQLAERVATTLNLAADPVFRGELRPGLPGRIAGKLRLGSAETEADSEARETHAIINRLLDMLSIDAIRGSRLVRINIAAHDPKLAAEIANMWTEAYVRLSIDYKVEASRSAGQMLTRQIDEQKAALEEIEKKLHEYTRGQGIFSYEVMRDNTHQRIAELNSMLTNAEAQRIKNYINYQAIKTSPLASEVAVKDPLVQKLREEIARLEGEYSDMLNVFKPDYPDCIRLRSRIEQIDAAVQQQTRKYVETAEAEYLGSEQQIAALEAELQQLQQQAMFLQDVAVDYNSLYRELQTNSGHYEALLARRKEALSATQIRASKISVVDLATVPVSPHSPNKALNLSLALILGLLAACTGSVVKEYMDNSVRSAEDVEHDVGEHLLGIVPEIEEDNEIGPENRDLISHLDSKSAVSEAYRTIRTSLAFSCSQRDTRNIVISSAMPGEGKTLTAINIAIVLGQVGERVLLVDADMRRPRLHTSLQVPNVRGLSTYLAGYCQLDDLIRPTRLPNVDLITAGPTPPNPSELINSKRMTELLAQCKTRYDRVIIDTPPVMAVTDSRLAATKADGLIQVIHAGKTNKQCARLARKHFDSVGAHVIGAVLNNVHSENGRKYHYDGYYN